MGTITASIDILLALVLASAAAHKVFAFERLAIAAAKLTNAPQSFGRALNLAAAAWEASAALLILTAVGRPLGLTLAAVLWCAYGLLAWRSRRLGRSLDCGCTFGRHSEPDPLTVIRPFVLATIAFIELANSASPAFDTNAIFAGLAYFGFFLAAGELAVLVPLARRTSR